MRLGHCALTAKDPKALSEFYERFLGLKKLGEIVTPQSGAMVFLGTELGGPPQLQLIADPEGRHVAFQVDSLADLRRLYAEAPEHGARVFMSLDHRATLSFYVHDPDGNTCEVYWATGRSGGGNRPIDLTKSEEELLELIRS